MMRVLLIYIKNMIYVSIGLSISLFAAKYVSNICSDKISPKFRLIIFLLGTGMILVAAITRLSGDLQTWDGSSPVEHLFSGLFWAFSVVGTLLLVFDYCIGFFKK